MLESEVKELRADLDDQGNVYRGPVLSPCPFSFTHSACSLCGDVTPPSSE